MGLISGKHTGTGLFYLWNQGLNCSRVVESIKQLWIKIAFKHLKSHSSRLSWFRTFFISWCFDQDKNSQTHEIFIVYCYDHGRIIDSYLSARGRGD